ncbi:MAG: hypothetical protein GEU90_17535 [Gemmatimonas sp.]|nr:hypothetical protein [Gemmatimonas sp.]
MAGLLNDLHTTARSLRRTPGFTVVALLTVALAVGINSAIFSVIDGVLLRPLPYQEPDRLVRLYNPPPEEGLTVVPGTFSPQDFDDLEREATSFQQLATYFIDELPIVGGEVPQEVPAAYVSGDFFSTLGTNADLGRGLVAGDGARRQGKPFFTRPSDS